VNLGLPNFSVVRLKGVAGGRGAPFASRRSARTATDENAAVPTPSALDRQSVSKGKDGAQSGAVARTRRDVEGPAQRIEAVLHVGQPVATNGRADIKAAAIVGNLDDQLTPSSPKRTVALEACA
jgi:hypothetical protein